MGIFQQFPYSNFHEFNLDELIKIVKKWDHFYVDFASEIKEEVDNWLAAHPEATTTVMDGSITENKIYPPFLNASKVWINVASMVEDYNLDSDNIAQAITDALAVSNYIYIPEGDYTFNVEITTDCTMILDDNAIIRTGAGDPWNGQPIIYAHDCSFNMYGGVVCVGDDDASQVAIARPNGAIFLENCYDSSIINLTSPYSKTNGVIWVKDTINFKLENSRFKNMLRAAIFFCDSCKNVAVRNCYFNNSVPISGQTFCYFAYTGVSTTNPETVIDPIDGLIYENNYCIHSVDCALDTHGAKNVIIRNNIVLDTVCAITAYNDNMRVRRPEDWCMNNVIIENNYCESTRTNTPEATLTLPHPFLFIGSSCTEKPSDGTVVNGVTYYDWYGRFNAFKNCTVRNNVFITNNDYWRGAIYLNQFSSNIIFENNEFYFDTDSYKLISFTNCMNFRFMNNTTKSYSEAAANRCELYFNHSYGELHNNIGFRRALPVDNISHVKGLDLERIDNVSDPTVELGEVIYLNNVAKICRSFGLRRRDASAFSSLPSPLSFKITGGDGLAEMLNGDENYYIPFLALTLTDSGGTTSNAYVKEVLDREHFIIVNASGSPVSADTYSAVIRLADFTTLS